MKLHCPSHFIALLFYERLETFAGWDRSSVCSVLLRRSMGRRVWENTPVMLFHAASNTAIDDSSSEFCMLCDQDWTPVVFLNCTLPSHKSVSRMFRRGLEMTVQWNGSVELFQTFWPLLSSMTRAGGVRVVLKWQWMNYWFSSKANCQFCLGVAGPMWSPSVTLSMSRPRLHLQPSVPW